jgi:hypothetical protein
MYNENRRRRNHEGYSVTAYNEPSQAPDQGSNKRMGNDERDRRTPHNARNFDHFHSDRIRFHGLHRSTVANP